MKLIHRRQVLVLATMQIVGVLAFTSFVTLSRAEEASVEALKAGIEGVYGLQEWRRDGEILRPPSIDGLTVLLNNRLMYVVNDRAQASS